MLQGNFYQVEVILDELPQLSYIHQLKTMPDPVKDNVCPSCIREENQHQGNLVNGDLNIKA